MLCEMSANIINYHYNIIIHDKPFTRSGDLGPERPQQIFKKKPGQWFSTNELKLKKHCLDRVTTAR